nr:hypothetical protein [uncultured Rhodopila sp.]
MPPLADALHPWHDFYTLFGTASATLIGLLFVAASVGTGVFSADRRAAQRVFLTASVVDFSLVLAASLVILAPIPGWFAFGGMVLACGLCGLGYSCVVWRDTLREGLIHKIDLEDRTWYIALPIGGYACLTASGMAFAVQLPQACTALAVSMGLLLVTGIRNAWDITLWSMSRRQSPPPSPPGTQPPAP